MKKRMICKYCQSDQVVKYGCNMVYAKPKEKNRVPLEDALELTNQGIKIKNLKAFIPKKVPRRRFMCVKCGKTFTHKNTYGKCRYTKETIANSLYWYTQTAAGGDETAKYNQVKYRSTIYRWKIRFAKPVEKGMIALIKKGQYSPERFVDNTTHILRKLKINMMHPKVYEFLMSDNDTRMLMGWHFAQSKSLIEQYNFFEKMKVLPRPDSIMSDSEFKAVENQYNDPINDAGKNHVYHAELTKSLYSLKEFNGKNNSIERPIMTLKRPYKNTFRMIKMNSIWASQVFRIAYLNFGRRHGSLGCTPAEEAKIPIERGHYKGIDGSMYDIFKAFVPEW